ncbi:MAG: MFS transporter [Pseudooceanicola sp.]
MTTLTADPAPQDSAAPLGTAIAVLSVSSLTVMANATIAPALPGLRDHFAATPGIETLAGLVVTLPSLFVVLAAGFFGMLADRFDKRPLLMVAMAVYALGGASGLLAQDMTAMLAGRVALGLGVAGTMTLASAYIGTLWHGAARDRFTGHQVAAMNFGGIVFMTLGGFLAGLHWRAPFGIYFVAAPLMVYVWIALSRVPGKVPARDPDAGPAGSFPWSAFLWVGPFAMISMIAFYALPTRLPFLLDQRGLAGPLLTGMILSTATLVSIPGALLYGRLRRYAEPLPIMATAFLVMGCGIAFVSQAQTLWTTVAGVALAGAPLGVMFPNFIAFFMSLVPMEMRGRAGGLFTMSVFGGQFLSPLVTAPLIAAFGLGGGLLALALLPLAAALVTGLGGRRVARRARG